MLPAESLADVLALFKYYDLGSLLQTNNQFSDLARQFTSRIRTQDFSELHFCLAINSKCFAYHSDASWRDDALLWEHFVDEAAMSEFISEAFRYCVIGNLAVVACSGRVLGAIKEAAKTIIVTNSLSIDVQDLHEATEHEVIDFVDAFHRVRKLVVSEVWGTCDTDLSEIKDFCQRKNIAWGERY